MAYYLFTHELKLHAIVEEKRKAVKTLHTEAKF